MSDENEGTIPAARLSEMAALKNTAISERDVALSRITSLEADLAAHTATIATHATALEGHAAVVQSHADAAAGWASRESAWTETESIYQTGMIDGEAIEVARMFHGKLPEANRPAIAEWLTSIKADPTTAPRALAAYLDKPAAAAAPAVVPAPAPVVVAPAPVVAVVPRVNPAAGVVTPTGAPATGTKYTAEQIRAATDKMRLGDLEEYKAMRPGVLSRNG